MNHRAKADLVPDTVKRTSKQKTHKINIPNQLLILMEFCLETNGKVNATKNTKQIIIKLNVKNAHLRL